MSAVAPAAPGRLGVPVEARDLLSYLSALTDWVSRRREELDALDAAVLASPERRSLTSDIALSMTIWQAVKDRTDLLEATWDSGRVGPVEREKLSTLIWGRLEPGGTRGSGSALGGASLPEACRLSDALAGQLRSRLNLDASAEQHASRLRDLRAQLERIRDQVALEPPAARQGAEAKLTALSLRVAEISQKQERGGDVGGLIGPLEIDAARYERDLIVGGARRREARDKLELARVRLGELRARGQAVSELVARTVATLDAPPKYAVPDLDALGPVPNTAQAIDTYVVRLDQVGRALDVVEQAYGQAMAGYEKLGVRISAVRAKSGGQDPVVGKLLALTDELFARRPAPVEALKALVAGLEWLTGGGA